MVRVRNQTQRLRNSREVILLGHAVFFHAYEQPDPKGDPAIIVRNGTCSTLIKGKSGSCDLFASRTKQEKRSLVDHKTKYRK